MIQKFIDDAGPNPLFGALKSTVSFLGRSHSTWIEGEGVLHAIYFEKDSSGKWSISYKNKYVESETFKIEKERNKPCFLPAIEGESPAIIAAYLLNMVCEKFSNLDSFVVMVREAIDSVLVFVGS